MVMQGDAGVTQRGTQGDIRMTQGLYKVGTYRSNTGITQEQHGGHSGVNRDNSCRG